MSTTFSYVIFPHHKRKDGTITVKIRMIHNSRVKYCATSVAVTAQQLTKRMDRITDPRILDAVNAKLDDYRRAAALIANAEWLSADVLWERLNEQLRTAHVFELDIFKYAEQKMRAMEPKTAEGYRSSFNMLRRFVGDRLDVNDVTYQFLVKFREFIEQQTSKGSRAVSYYLSCLRRIHNLARAEYNDDDTGVVRIPRQPFRRGLIPPQPVTEHRVLTLQQLKSLRDCQPQSERGRLAKDVFMLSYALIGMNTVDLYHLDKKSLKNDILIYNRCKTDTRRQDNAEMRVRVEPEADEIIKRHAGRRGMLDFSDRYASHQNFNKAVNLGLKELGTMIGVEGLSTYYARHTWATLARNLCKIEKSTVHEALNHAPDKSERVTDIYVEKDWERIWDANRIVLDAFTYA